MKTADVETGIWAELGSPVRGFGPCRSPGNELGIGFEEDLPFFF